MPRRALHSLADRSGSDSDDCMFDQTNLLQRRRLNTTRLRRSSATISGQRLTVARTVNLCLSFFALGLCFVIPTATINGLQYRTASSEEQIEFIYTARYGGYIVGCFAGGFLFNCYNRQFLLFVALLATAVGVVIMPFCRALSFLMTCTCVTGITMGLLDTGGNVWLLDLWGRKSAPFMQTMHFCFGLGALVAPLVAQPFIHPYSEFGTHLAANASRPILPPLGPHLSGNAHPQHLMRRDLTELNANLSQSLAHALVSSTPGITVLPPAVTSTPTSTSQPLLTTGAPVLPKKPHFADSKKIDDIWERNPTVGNGTASKHVKTPPRTEPAMLKEPGKASPALPVSTTTAASSANFASSARPEPVEKLPPVTTPKQDSLSTSTESGPPDAASSRPPPRLPPPPKTQASTSQASATQAPTTRASTVQASTAQVSITQASTGQVSRTQAPTTTTTTKSPLSTARPAQRDGLPPRGKSRDKPPKADEATRGSTMKTTASTVPTQSTPPVTSSSGSDEPPAITERHHSIKKVLPDDGDVSGGDGAVDSQHQQESWIEQARRKIQKSGKFEIAYAILAAYVLLVSIIFLLFLCLNPREAKSKQEEELDDLHQHSLMRIPLTVLVCTFFFLYMGVEVAVGETLRSLQFHADVHQVVTGEQLIYIFWGSFAFARGVSIFVSMSVSCRAMLICDIIVCIGAAVTLVAGAQLPYVLIAGIAVLGSGMASIIPTTFIWLERHAQVTNRLSALVILSAAVGEMVIPELVAAFIHKTPMALMYVILAVILLCTANLAALCYVMSVRGEKYMTKPDRSLYQLASLDDDQEHWNNSNKTQQDGVLVKRNKTNSFFYDRLNNLDS